MGNYATRCFEDEEQLKAAKHSGEIDKKLNAAARSNRKYLKLLLLGTGESGKSTVFKQVRELYGEKWTVAERRDYRTKIYGNINLQILAMLEAGKKLGIPLTNPRLAKRFTDVKYDYQEGTDIDADVAQDIMKLWKDKGMQEIWRRRREYQVLDCIEYYVAHLKRIGVGRANYLPSFEDVLQCRVRTTGIVDVKFMLFGAHFEMYDVGGQRSERKKWIKCFDNVVTIIFLAAINEYDQFLLEDNSKNRTNEAINVWRDIVNRPEFRNVGFVLFLNKYDLFRRKVVEFPYRDDSKNQNSDYEGPDPMKVPRNEVERAITECAEHAREKFYDVIDARIGYGSFISHFTTAIDTNLMDTVFHACQEQILKRHLVVNGFPIS